jgi:hypothetical protein
MQGIISKYLVNLYSNKLENLKEMDKFLDPYYLTKLSQKDINHLTSNEIETEIVSQKRKVQG